MLDFNEKVFPGFRIEIAIFEFILIGTGMLNRIGLSELINKLLQYNNGDYA